jgi:L-asparagine transporter-like permease
MFIKVKRPLKDNIIINLALILPFLIVFAILSGVLGAAILNRFDLLIRGSIVAIPGIFAAITLSYIYKNSNERKEHNSSLLNFSEKKCIKLFCIFYLSSFIILLMSTTRPLQYLIIILILYFIVFIQIFFL